MRTTIRMNNELARRAKEFAHQSGRSFTQVIEEAVVQLLSHRSRPPGRRRRIALPVAGDPKNKITEEQYRGALEEMELEDALREAGLGHHEAD